MGWVRRARPSLSTFCHLLFRSSHARARRAAVLARTSDGQAEQTKYAHFAHACHAQDVHVHITRTRFYDQTREGRDEKAGNGLTISTVKYSSLIRRLPT